MIARMNPVRALLLFALLLTLLFTLVLGPVFAKQSALYNAAPPAVQQVVDEAAPEAEAYTFGSSLVFSTLSDRASVLTYDGRKAYYLPKGKTTWHKDRFVVPSGCIGYLNINLVKVVKIGPGTRYMAKGTAYSLNIQC